jgi:hypothetical protein
VPNVVLEKLVQPKIGAEINSIINLVCCKALIGYGGIIVIGLGRLIEYNHPKQKNYFHGQWEIRTNSASWRVLNGKEIVVGDYDDESLIKARLDSLIGAKLVDIRLQSLVSDAKFVFDNDMVFEFFGTSVRDYSWELIGPTINIEAQPNKTLVKIESDFVESLDPSEERISIHSEACSQRWEFLIPAKTKDHKCRNCSYYRAFQGQYFFWDYGLCSNAESIYDGKVVNINSGCEKYRSELKNT